MGLLLKLALLGVALYAAYKTFSRWKGLYDRFVGPPPAPPKPAPPPSASEPAPTTQTAQARPKVIEETVQCAGCDAYVSTAAEKCGHCGRPLP